ncbi:MAG: hypothetical protein ACFFCF_02310 [Promethearchaeota archaeon]
MKHYSLLVLFLFSLVFVSPLLVSTPWNGVGLNDPFKENSQNLRHVNGQGVNSPPLPSGPTYDEGKYKYLGTGNTSQTWEMTQGTYEAQTITDLDIGESVAASAQLPTQWTAYKTSASIYNLFENRSWQSNGDFESGTYGEPGSPTNWNYIENGDPINYANINGSYGNYGYGPSDGIRTLVEWEYPPEWSWSSSYFGAYYQTVNIPRAAPSLVRLDFKCRLNAHIDGGAWGRMVVLVQLEGDQVVERRLTFASIGSAGSWYDLTIDLGASDIAKLGLPGNLNITLGISWTDTSGSWSTCRYSVDFDDVVLQVRAQPQPTQVGLQINGTAVVNDGYGAGNLNLTGGDLPKANPSTNWIAILNNFTTTADNIDLACDLTLFIRKEGLTKQTIQSTQIGSLFVCENASATSFETWYYAYQPYGFEAYNLTISKPTTWTLTSVIDPLGTQRLSWVENSSTQITLNSSAINEVFGWWKFTFSSTNRYSLIEGLVDNYVISPRTPYALDIDVTFTENYGEANLSLYHSSGSALVNQTNSWTGSLTTSFYVEFTSGANFPAGRYSLCISYDNGVNADIIFTGFYSTYFNLTHDTDLTPEDTPMTVTHSTSGYYYPRVSFTDADRSNLFIGNTTGNVRVNGTVDGNAIIFVQVGSRYQAQIANDLLDPGDYVLSIEATAPFYEKATCNINLQVRSDASLSSPQSPGLTVPYDESFTIQVFYNYTGGQGIAGATVTTNWGPTGTSNGTAGWYNITLNAGSRPTPGTYSLSIQASLNYYTTRTLVLTIVVREISTSINYDPPGAVPYDEDVEILFTLNVSDLESQYDGDAIASASFVVRLDGTILTQDVDYLFTNYGDGSYNVTILAISGKISLIKSYSLRITADPTDTKYGSTSGTLTFTIRELQTILSYDPPAPEPWGNDLEIIFYYDVDDPASGYHGDGITTIGVSEVSCTLNSSAVSSFGWTHLGSGQYRLTLYTIDITQVDVYELYLVVNDATDIYAGANRRLFFHIRAHQTQAIVDPPAQTALGENTLISIVWTDLETATDVPGNLSSVVVSNCPVGGDQTFGSLSFWLQTNGWSVGTYVLTVTVNPANPPGWYEGDSTTVNVVIRIHYTGVTVQPPDPTPWGFYTTIIVLWTDLDIGGSVPGSELSQIVVSDCPVGGDQTFTTLIFNLDTSGWDISAGYLLNVTVYAKTGPQSYSDASGSVIVVIRIHRVEVVVPTPPPTPWGFDIEDMTVTWKDLDTGTTIAGVNLDNITISDCPVGGDQVFSSLIFTLITNTWSQGSYTLNVTVYPNMIPQQEYAITSYQVTITIRAHYVSVTVDPPAQTPWGYDTDLTITWRDVDTDSIIAEINLDNVTVTNCPVGGDQTFATLSFSLTTNGWSVGSHLLTVYVYGNADYRAGSGPVTVTIRGHQTQTVVTPPQQTPFGLDTAVIVSWLDLDQGSNPVPGANLLQIVVSNCPVGGDQTFTSFTFTLDTDAWNVGTYTLTVTTFSSSSSYLGSSSNTTVVIRIHYTGVTVQPPDPTPWGFNTQITVLWSDLDLGSAVPGGDLYEVVVSDCPDFIDQTFTSLTFTLDTTGWTISTGYTLNVTVYATTGPRAYSDAWGSVTVVIRIHRVEVVVPTPPPTPWGFDIEDMTVTWKDLDTGTTIAGVNLDNITISDCPVGGDQTFTSLTFTLITSTWSQGSYTLNVTVFPEMSPQLYRITNYLVTVTIRAHYVSVTVDPPAQTPWGYDTDLAITWRDVDTDSIIAEVNLDNVTVTNCPVGGDQSFSSLSFTLTTNGWSVGSHLLTVWVYGTTDYVLNSGQVTVTIRGHQTQTVVTPPQQTPFGFDAPMAVTWLDLDQGSANVPGGNLLQIVVSNCPVGGNQIFTSLTFTLDTDTWNIGEYVITVTTFSSSSQYLGSSSNTTVIIRIHYTGVIVQPPNPRPWGFNTQITVIWTDLDSSIDVPGAQLYQVVVSDCPDFIDQTFTSLTFTLDTAGWDISSGYTLNVTVYATTGPRTYSDAWGSVTVVIRIHRVEVVVPTPAPTAWGSNIIDMSVTWKDLDTGTTIDGANLDTIVVSDCPVGGDQTFTSLTFTLITNTWSIGQYTLNITVYPITTPFTEYETANYQLTITIRAHYVSVTVSPPTPTPWGKNTQLTVIWRDVDTDTLIDLSALDNVTVTGTEPNLPYSVSQLAFTLSTSGWTVGGHNLVVWVYGNASYNPGNGPVIVTISPHQTQTIVSPPGQTPFGFDTPIVLSWVDLDLGSTNVPTGNLSQVVVTNCPFGGDQTFFALSFTIDTNGWVVGNHILTVTIQPDLGQGWYYQSSSNLTVSIRIHYTAVVVETPAPTPWGFDTNLVILWTDLDTGAAVPLNNLSQVIISNCPIGGDQSFLTLTPTLITSTWPISMGETLTVTIYATNTRYYSDAVGSVTVGIRVHRVEIVVPTPPPTPWGANTPMTITWKDLDTGMTIDSSNLKNVTITGGPTGDQDFSGLSFTLDTLTWNVGSYTVTVTVNPLVIPEQEYEIGTYQVTITIRAHYVSVTVDPPAAEPWGDDTQLVVYWRDVDIDALIAEINLNNVTVAGSGPGLPYMDTALIFTLPTNTWSVGSYALTVWVFGNTNYYNSSGPVTVTIRSHAMRLDITPPSATAWGLSTHLIVKWWDLDDGVYVSSNLDNITITDCPDAIDQTFYTFTFDLDTTDDTVWQSPNTYYVTVNFYSSSALYQHASAQIPITIRIHYTNVIVQPPSPTPWGTVTPIVVEWRDLDLGNSPIDPSNLYRTYVYNRTSGSQLEWFTQLAFNLDTTLMPPWNFGTHPINVTVYAESVGRKYGDAWATTQITIRRHRVNVVINPPSTIPEGGDVNITVFWEDVDTGGDIPESYLDYVTTTGSLGYPSPTAVNYSLSFLLSAQGWPTLLHTLNVTVYPLDTERYDIQWGLVTIQIRRHNIRIDIDPIPQIPWNNNTRFTMRVNDSDLNSPLDGSIERITILAGGSRWIYDWTNWTLFVTNITTGVYSVLLPAASWSLGSHAIIITSKTTAEYNDGTIQTSATIRALATSFLFTPATPIPWGNDGTLLVHYHVQDEGSTHDTEAITGATITISGWTEGIQFNSAPSGTPGTYIITINAAFIDQVQIYYLDIQIAAGANYYGAALDNVPLDVRQLFTTLAYSQVPSQPFGDDVNITVNYIVFDVQSIYHEGPILGATITVKGLDFTLGSSYQIHSIGGGAYIIEIDQSVLPTIRAYHIAINASLPPQYRLANIPSMGFNVRTVYTEVEKPPVEAAAYNTNFTMTVIYRVRDDLSSQNGLGIAGATDITVAAIGPWTLNPGEYSVFDAGNGIYYIYINSSFTPGPGIWQVNITIDWLDPIPTYKPQWVLASLTTTERATQARITLPPDTGYANNITIHVNYFDILSGLKIDNTTWGSDVRIYVINASDGTLLDTQYWVAADYSNPNYVFTIRILASDMGKVDVYYDFNINVTWVGNAPFYANASATFTVRVAGTPTVGFADAVQGVPFGESLNLTLHYETAEGQPINNNTGNVGISVLPVEDDIPGWDDTFWWIDQVTLDDKGAGGIYRILINGSKLPGFGSYVFAINFTWPPELEPGNEDFFESTTLFVAGQVQEIITFLEWEQNEDLYYGELLNITVWYVDTYNDENVTGVIWDLNPNLEYTNSTGKLGSMILLINTSSAPAGQFTFTLTANRPNYIEASRAISVQVKSHPLNLNRIQPVGLVWECNYLDDIEIIVYLESALPGGEPIRWANITFNWEGSLGLLNQIGDGHYNTTLHSIDAGAGTWQLILRVEWGLNYTQPILVYTLTINQVATEMNVPPGSYAEITKTVESNIQLNISFTSSGVPIPGADVYAIEGGTRIANFSWVDPYYIVSLETADWEVRPYQILVTAISANYEQGNQLIIINLIHKPLVIITFDSDFVNTTTNTIETDYGDIVTFDIFLQDSLNGSGILGATMNCTWGLHEYTLTYNATHGRGWYTVNFTADDRPGSYAFKIIHEIQQKYARIEHLLTFKLNSRNTTLQFIDGWTWRIIDGEFKNVSLNPDDALWEIPRYDTLFLVFQFLDKNDMVLTPSDFVIARFSAASVYDLNYSSGLWFVEVNLDAYYQSALTVNFYDIESYFVSRSFTLQLNVIQTPTTLRWADPNQLPLNDIYYVGEPIILSVVYWDQYHQCAISGADFQLDGVIENSVVRYLGPDENNPGYYEIEVSGSWPAQGIITFTVTKTDYDDAELAQFFSLQFTELTNMLIISGIGAAIFLTFVLILWTLWARVLSIPWEVRRLRKFAKSIEKDQTYSLGRKDRKRFHVRDAVLESKVDSAMSTIGVTMTPAMVPVVTITEEVTATQEDIISELDKIPGLGPEEKAVLAAEMRKIPMKDQVWFLDDLKRQMGEKRMDFLTKREPAAAPPKEAPPPKLPPPEKVPPPKKLTPRKEVPPKKAPKPPKPDLPPLEDVEPVEPPDSKVFTEDRTAPTVLPPDLQPIPSERPEVVEEIRRELDKIPGLTKEDKVSLVDHLKHLTKEEREATYRSLRQTTEE